MADQKYLFWRALKLYFWKNGMVNMCFNDFFYSRYQISATRSDRQARNPQKNRIGHMEGYASDDQSRILLADLS